MTITPHTRRNLSLLVVAQALMQSAAITSVAVSGLAGILLAPDVRLATLPFALITVSIAASTLPVSYLMQAVSRRAGFLLGAVCGVIASILAVTALLNGSFLMLCLASPFQGVYQASSLYYRYAAVEASPPDWASRAISLILIGGVFAAIAAPTAGRYANEAVSVAPYVGPYAMMMGISLVALIPIALLDLAPMVSEEHTTGPVRPIWQIFGSAKGLTAVVCGVSGWSIMVLLMVGVPLEMAAHGFNFNHSSQVIQWHVLAMYIPAFFTGTLIARVGVFPILLAGVLAMAAAVVLGYPANTFLEFVLSLMLVGLGWNFLFVGSTTLLTQLHRANEKAKTQGAFEFMSFAASAIGAIASGAIVTGYGWGTLNLVAAGIVVLAFVVTVGYGMSLRQESRQSGEAVAATSGQSEDP